MGHKNGSALFPPESLRQIQDYIDGEYIYIPRLSEKRKHWGDTTNTCSILDERNSEIYNRYKKGISVRELSEVYCISRQGIYKILSAQRHKV